MKKTKKLAYIGLIFGFTLVFGALWGCSTTPRNSASTRDDLGSMSSGVAIRPEALSHEMAWVRAHQIGKLHYILWFGLEDQSDTYEGRVVVNFELKDLKKAIFGNSPKDSSPKELPKQIQELSETIALDFEGGELHTLSVNGTVENLNDPAAHSKPRYDSHRIYFPINELLASGSNRIEISFSHHFSSTGGGFVRFVDTEDAEHKQTYLYTDSEPYAAHWIFPCFDQPDLKSSYELTVETPQDWQVITNTPERDVNTVDGRKSWAFPPSPVFSTYLFELAAGPYFFWKENADGIPIRLFVRQSQKSFIDSQDWLETTKKGLDYYSSYFGYPYPYAKYDQIMVPDYQGAMENVAAVTFGEASVEQRTKFTARQKLLNEGTVLHEMAHMWFGDLVTMKWWNGLWLNESFATYMSYRAMGEIFSNHNHASETSPGLSWEYFYDEVKNSAEAADELVTTHPVESQIIGTDEAFSNFDSITYGKGASVLKQLNYFIGEENFQEGLQRYFEKYALRNTTTNDFVKMMGEASEKDLTQWQKLWLQSSGINGVKANWSCDGDGKINKFSLSQSPANEGDKELRPHKTQIALYKLNSHQKAELRAKDVVEIVYSGAETNVDSLVGKECPEFVYPNHMDYDYAKVELDPVSLEFAKKNLSHFDSTMLRKVIWNNFWSLVLDGKVSPTEMISQFLADGASEKDPDILNSLLDKIIGNPRGSRNQSSLLKYLTEAQRTEAMPGFEQTMLKMLKAAPGGSDLQKIWFNAWTRVALSDESQEFADKLFSGKAKLRGFQVGQSERWSLVQMLARNATTPEKQATVSALIAAESKIDPSDDGVRRSITAQVLVPDPENKKKWLSYLLAPLEGGSNAPSPVTDTGISLNTNRLKTAATAYLSNFSPALALTVENTYFASLPKLAKIADNPYAASFASGLFPSFCDQRIVDETSKAIDNGKGLPPEVLKRLKIARQDEGRCIRAQRKLSSTGQ